jgi:hypothetical protein
MRNRDLRIFKGVLRLQGTFFVWRGAGALFLMTAQFRRRLRNLINSLNFHKNPPLSIMKKITLLLAIFTGTFFSCSAQYYSNNSAYGPKFGLGLSSGIATGAASGAFPEAGGLSLNLELPINKSPVSFIVTTGYTFYVSQGGYSLDFFDEGFGASTDSYGDIASFIPIEAGLKIYVAPKFFIEGFAGASFNVNSYPTDYTGRSTAFIYAPGAGYSFPLGYNEGSRLDISLLYENRVEPGGGYSQVAVRGVWNFKL